MSEELERDEIERAIRRLLTEQRLTRRGFLRTGAAISIPALLAACGISPTANPTPTGATTATPGGAASPSATPEPTPSATPSGQLNFANWPLYIDTDEQDPSKHKTLEDFTRETRIRVKYEEAIQDNEQFVGTLRPDLSAGNPIGWDLIVVTDWMVNRMATLGWLEEIDLAGRVPNFEAHAADIYKNPAYDPLNRHSVPWQAGITGIGYNRRLTGRDITSIEDLWDPKFAGRIGMFSEMRDTMGLALLSLGIRPQDATNDDARRAQAKLKTQRGVRKYYGNEYTDELAGGNLAISMAWSGDVYQLALYDNPDLRFVIPKEGGLRWVDNMVIPKNAEHPVDAQMMMNFVYRPEIATQISEYIGYFSPVKEVPEMIRQHARQETDPETKKQLEFVARTVAPTPAQLANVYLSKTLNEDDERLWNELFQDVVTG
jgi:spermidine/putrescine transport system substrate-binding protein